MFTLWSLWEIVINIVESYFFYYMLKKQLGYLKSNTLRVFCSTAILIAITTTLNFSNLDFRILMIIMFVLMLVYACTLFNGTTAMRVIWGCCGVIVILIANLLTSAILSSLSFLAINDTLSPSFSRFIATTLYASLCIVFFLLLSRIPKSTILLPRSLQIFVIVVVSIGTILSSQIVALAFDINYTVAEHNFQIALSFSLLLMLLAIIYLVHKVGSTIQKEIQTKSILQKIYLEQQNYECQQEMMRIWNHDNHHHINVLQAYISQKDLAGAERYLRKMSGDLDAVTSSINTGNSVIDSILSYNLRICQSANIPFRITSEKLERFPLGETKTSSLFGNLLDNAIEACKSCHANDIFIDLQIVKNRGMIIITVTNSSDGEYKYHEGNLVTKKSTGHHGYGLLRIKQIVDDAGGFFRVVESSDRFKVEIYLSEMENENEN